MTRTDLSVAPWTDEEVHRLVLWQSCPWVHPYTCGYCREADPHFPLRDEHRLVPTNDGWRCPTCDMTQDWCLAMMVAAGPFSNPLTRWPGSTG
jgi:hypothetical protein